MTKTIVENRSKAVTAMNSWPDWKKNYKLTKETSTKSKTQGRTQVVCKNSK